MPEAGLTSINMGHFQAVAITVILWDHCLKLCDEVRLIWRQPWTALQAIIMVNRYGGDISLLFVAYSD